MVGLIFLRSCIGVRAGLAVCTKLRNQSRETRERVLLQDLFTMRAIISQYTLDKQKRPHSLDDLVAAGYLKEVPVDPLTGRKDTWVVKCSSDGSEAGIVDIDSGYGKTSNEGTRPEPCR